MSKNTLWLVLILVCIYFTLVFCEEQQQQQQPGTDFEDTTGDLLRNDSTDLQEEARTRRRHRHHLCKFYEKKGRIVKVDSSQTEDRPRYIGLLKMVV